MIAMKKLSRKDMVKACIQEHFEDLVVLDIVFDKDKVIPIVSFNDISLETVPAMIAKLANRFQYELVVLSPPCRVRPKIVYKLKEAKFYRFTRRKGLAVQIPVEVLSWLRKYTSTRKKKRRNRYV
jgi:hypothetical protein